MKKLLAITLAVLGISAAQALTLSWAGESATGQVMTPTVETGKAVNSVTLVAVATFKQAGKANFLMVDLAGTGKLYTARMTEQSKISFATSENTVSTLKGTSVNVVAGQQFSLMMIFAKTSDDRTEMSFYIDGVRVHTDGYTGLNSLSLSTWENSTYLDLDGVAYYDGVATNDEIAKFAEDRNVFAVPEPTVLALLALGVAGVALRRKKVVA